MRKRPSAAVTLIAAMASLAMTAVLALQSPAAAKVSRPSSLPNLQGLTSDHDPAGMQCRSVPLTGGGEASLSMRLTSDSRKTIAHSEYTYSLPYLGAAMPLGRGVVTVLKDTRTTGGATTTSQRWWRTQAQADVCSYSTVGLVGETTLVHRVQVERPTQQAVRLWCESQSWYADLPQYCPWWLTS